jgi:hypothetical protein
MNTEKLLVVKNRIAQIRELYANSSSVYSNILVAGVHGSGKTQLYSTCPTPVHIDSFDPGGTTTAALQPLIQSGDVIVELFENDDWDNPFTYRAWERSFIEKQKSGYFELIGTYGLDSATNWVIALMGQIMKVGKGKNVKPHPGGNPYESDYLHQQLIAANILKRDIMSLPCHTLITGHLTFIQDKDEEGNVLNTRADMLMWGKLAMLFPLVFDENYVMLVKRTSSGPEHQILTGSDGLYQAKTRMGGAKFAQKEVPDIRALLKKAGKNYEDKPKII